MVIGLLLALTACFSPSTLHDYIVVGSSRVFEDIQCDYYLGEQFELELDSTEIEVYTCPSWNTYNYVESYNDNSLVDNTSIFLTGVYNSYYSDYEDNIVTLFAQKSATGRTIQVHNANYTFKYFVRVCVPLSSNINGVEIYNYNGLTAIFNGSMYSDAVVYTNEFTRRQNQYNRYGGIYQHHAKGVSDADSTGVWHVTGSNDLSPIKFASFLIGFEDGNFDKLKFNMYFVDIDLSTHGYSYGYQIGYGDGVQQGWTDGYSVGYTEARDYFSTHDSTFMSLFGAIADTPIRMIYGLFNFDLFGVSVITIVLTCLTGIVLFGIVKRFIK